MPGFFNLRDIGGYATESSRIARRTVLRANAPLVPLAESGEAFRNLGVRLAIDLREESERESDGAWFADAGIEVVACPLIDGVRLTEEHYNLRYYNRWLLDQRAAQMAQAFRVLCRDDAAFPAMIFCTSGKDRTGMITALILAALGVSDEDICSDYQVTEGLIPKAHIEAVMASFPETGISEATARAAFAAPSPVMADTLTYLRTRHGGARRYLTEAGVPRDALDRLTTRLIEPSG